MSFVNSIGTCKFAQTILDWNKSLSPEYTIMASEHYTCKAEPNIGKDGMEQIPTYFVDIHDILKREIKEEATEFKPFSDGESNECLENENGKFDYTNSSELEVMPRDTIEDPTESKLSPARYRENTHFHGLAGEFAKPNVNHFNNGVILKNEDEELSLSNEAESKMETLKTEDDIDIVCEDVKPEICEEKSNEKCESKQELHERTHIGEKRFQCQNCSKSFTTKSKLFRHESIHTEIKPFQCKICSKSFTQKCSLVTHERIHTGEKPFQCKICLKPFTDKRGLTKHGRTHTGEKLFQCKICLKSFTQKCSLAHERIHTGEKPFQCKICSKSFNMKDNLTKHERTHTGEKPFQCQLCAKSFIQKSDLMKHVRIHTGEKPFQCKICEKSFSEKCNLTKHERIHTGKNHFTVKFTV